MPHRTVLAGIACFAVISPVGQAQDAMPFADYFRQDHTRCGTPDPRLLPGLDSPSDCSLFSTNPDSAYDPGVGVYRIPVVVHVIQRTDGTGFIPDARVRSQIDILNEDFRAIAGTLGEPGADCGIEFYLAVEDPDGNPTDGIINITNNTWYNDSGRYWETLAWDTNRYLNIYTNSAGGYLGYVPDLPQGGIVGDDADRVVVLHEAFGRDAPLRPFNLGRTATHEVGHYLGLYHTFDGGCGSASSCDTTGDLICDTNGQSSPTWGCPSSSSSCGMPAPFDNYMDYSDDRCMNKFTPDQARRMRCTLENYRPDVYSAASAGCSPADLAEPFGELNVFDFLAFQNLFATGDLAADLDGDGSLTIFDFLEFQTLFASGC
ncbi:MAG: M43 family zinc metalloprotease [Phycisphaerales bacterium JB060]